MLFLIKMLNSMGSKETTEEPGGAEEVLKGEPLIVKKRGKRSSLFNLKWFSSAHANNKKNKIQKKG